jgi:ABC-2 type transport system permease protein
MLWYNLIMAGLIVLCAIAAAICVPHFDYSHVFVGILGVYLLLCAYSAIGLFMSSLTTYQVVAAILTFVVLAFFSYVGGFFQGTDFLRDICYSLWIPNRPVKMLMGLLTTRDVIYFLAIMFMFIAFTISKLWMARTGKKTGYKIVRYVVISIAGMGITYLSSRPGWIGYWDATEIKMNTISQHSQDILKRMGDDPVEITEYINALGDGFSYGIPEKRNEDMDRWEPFIRFKPNIHVHYVYYYDTLGVPITNFKLWEGKSAKFIFEELIRFQGYSPSMFKTPEEIRKMIDLRGEGHRVVMQVQYKGKKMWLRTFDDPRFWPSEPEISACFKRMLQDPARVVFAYDGYERSMDKLGDRDYKVLTNWKTFRLSLINQGYSMDSVSLAKDEIPDNIATLVLADRRTSYDTMALGKIRRYIDKGGNLLIAGEPKKRDVINPLLHELGIQMLDGQIVQKSEDYSFDLATSFMTPAAAALSLTLKFAQEDSTPISMPSLGGLVYSHTGNFTVKPFLRTDSEHAWNKMGSFVLDSAVLQFEAAHGDQKGTFDAGLSLTRMVNGKEQRIFVSGDADWMSNAELSRGRMLTMNFAMSNVLFGWFSREEFPIDTEHPRSTDNSVWIRKVGIEIIKWTYFGIIPGAFLILGTVILIRRKRK